MDDQTNEFYRSLAKRVEEEKRQAPLLALLRISEQHLNGMAHQYAEIGFSRSLPILICIILSVLLAGTLLFGEKPTAAIFGALLAISIAATLLLTDRRETLDRQIGSLERALIDAGFKVTWRQPVTKSVIKSPSVSVEPPPVAE